MTGGLRSPLPLAGVITTHPTGTEDYSIRGKYKVSWGMHGWQQLAPRVVKVGRAQVLRRRRARWAPAARLCPPSTAVPVCTPVSSCPPPQAKANVHIGNIGLAPAYETTVDSVPPLPTGG